jgi:hypothetical protein
MKSRSLPFVLVCTMPLMAMSLTLRAATTNQKLVVAGSSVPKGEGTYAAGTYYDDFDQDGNDPGVEDDFSIYGYAGRLRLLLTAPLDRTDPRDSTTGWTFENVSIAGNSTSDLLARFDPDVTRQYAAPKVAGNEPEYVLLALSLGNEGLAGATDAESVLSGYLDGVDELIALSEAKGYRPVVALPYARGNYTAAEYAIVQRGVLALNERAVPSVNLLGALDDGAGRWADGFFFNAGHPNFLGHAELFYAIPPTLFAALEAGKPLPSAPSGSGFARIWRDAAVDAPLVFEPATTLHAFTLSFRVRASSTGTVVAVREALRPLLLVDFGPSNDDDGRATVGADAFGRHWNSWRPAAGGAVIPAGTELTNLVDVDGDTLPTGF